MSLRVFTNPDLALYFELIMHFLQTKISKIKEFSFD